MGKDWYRLTQMDIAYQSYQKITGTASDLKEKTKACMPDRRSDISKAID